ARTGPEVSPAFVITCAFVRIVPVRETTKPEPWAAVPPKYEKTVTTPGERLAKIRAGAKPDETAGTAGRRTTARVGRGWRASRTPTVFVELPPTSPAARPIPSAAAAPTTAQASARAATRTSGL